LRIVLAKMDERQYASFGQTAFGSVSGSKLARIKQYAGKSILDVGCGPGLYLERLCSLGYQVAGVDGNSIFIQKALKYTEQVYKVDLNNDSLSQFPDGSFDTVLMLDILEHVVDDKSLLKDALRVSRQNILISVPAEVPEGMKDSQLIFASYVDPTHVRYYSFESLQGLLRSTGLREYQIFNSLGFTPVISDIFPWYLKHPLRLVNRFLKRITDPKVLTSVWFAVASKTS